MRIRYRIVIPFAVLFLASYGLLAAFAIWSVAGAVEAGIVSHLKALGRFSTPDKNFQVLFKQHLNVDTVVEIDGVFARDISTMPPEKIEKPLRRAPFGAREYAELIAEDGSPFLAVHVPRDGNWGVYLLYPGAILDEQKLKAVGPLVGLSLAGLVGVLLMGFVIARSIAQPIEKISAAAATLKDLPSPLEVPSGGREIRQLARALADMLSALKASQAGALEAQKGRLIKELAASVAHEIKNPLQAIQMLIQMQEGMNPEDKRMLLGEIVRIELASLELLSLETPASPKLERISLADVAEETLDLLSRQLEHLRIRVVRDLAGTPEIDGDRARLKRVILNLILNGAQAMPQGGELVVRLQRLGERVRFSVLDRGRGVPEEIRDRIFEPFVSTKGDGVGMGLYVSKRIVEAHRGRMGFDAQPGQTAFYFEVPCPTSSSSTTSETSPLSSSGSSAA